MVEIREAPNGHGLETRMLVLGKLMTAQQVETELKQRDQLLHKHAKVGFFTAVLAGITWIVFFAFLIWGK
jgi:hypothetical protein